MLYLPGQRQCLKLRVLSHGAGIENDKSGIFGRVREFISHDDRHSGKSFAVRLVLLTAEGLYVYPRFMSVLCLICKAVFKHKPSRGCVQYIFSHFRLLTTGRPVPTFYHYIIPHFCHGVNCNVPNFCRSISLPPSHSRDYSLPDKKTEWVCTRLRFFQLFSAEFCAFAFSEFLSGGILATGYFISAFSSCSLSSHSLRRREARRCCPALPEEVPRPSGAYSYDKPGKHRRPFRTSRTSRQAA